MPLQVNTEVARRVLQVMENHPDLYDWTKVHWHICRSCAWVGVSHEEGKQLCQRPEGEFNHYSGSIFYSGGLARPCPANTPQELLPRVLSDALWSALRMGGTNAVIEILNSWGPESLGWPSAQQIRKTRGGPAF